MTPGGPWPGWLGSGSRGLGALGSHDWVLLVSCQDHHRHAACDQNIRLVSTGCMSIFEVVAAMGQAIA